MKALVDSLFLLLGGGAAFSFSKGTRSRALGPSSDSERFREGRREMRAAAAVLASDWLVEILALLQKDDWNDPRCAKMIFLIGNWNFSTSAPHLLPALTQFECLPLKMLLVPSSSSSSLPPTHHLLHLQARKKAKTRSVAAFPPGFM